MWSGQIGWGLGKNFGFDLSAVEVLPEDWKQRAALIQLRFAAAELSIDI